MDFKLDILNASCPVKIDIRLDDACRELPFQQRVFILVVMKHNIEFHIFGF